MKKFAYIYENKTKTKECTKDLLYEGERILYKNEQIKFEDEYILFKYINICFLVNQTCNMKQCAISQISEFSLFRINISMIYHYIMLSLTMLKYVYTY
jgi:hypothetical protein